MYLKLPSFIICRYIHPIDERECPVVIGGDYITTESGTGLVHTAPGHGQEDYVTGLKYGLPIISPVDDLGKFTEEAGVFSGLDVLGDGNAAVVKFLDEKLSLILEESYSKLIMFMKNNSLSHLFFLMLIMLKIWISFCSNLSCS